VATNNIENRITNAETVRSNDKTRKVYGTAIVFNQPTLIAGRFWEKISDKAVTEELLQQDVRALFNHDKNLILGRTKAGTLKLEKTSKGLTYEFISPDTSAGNDLLENIRLGNVTGSSFGFEVLEDVWSKRSDGKSLRIILKFKTLYDVSPVTFPAYPSTDVGLRSMESYHTSQAKRERKLKLIKFKKRRL